MFIRFKAETYQQDGKTMVDIFDHQTSQTETMTIKKFHEKSDWYSHNGAVIFGQRTQTKRS
jgi:hypothetical protein